MNSSSILKFIPLLQDCLPISVPIIQFLADRQQIVEILLPLEGEYFFIICPLKWYNDLFNSTRKWKLMSKFLPLQEQFFHKLALSNPSELSLLSSNLLICLIYIVFSSITNYII